jgi:hypothetical protein
MLASAMPACWLVRSARVESSFAFAWSTTDWEAKSFLPSVDWRWYSAWACTSCAWVEAKLACACCSLASYGAGSITNSSVPYFTKAPSL